MSKARLILKEKFHGKKTKSITYVLPAFQATQANVQAVTTPGTV